MILISLHNSIFLLALGIRGYFKKKRGKVTVFFCGTPVMGKAIKVYCRKYGFGFRKENF